VLVDTPELHQASSEVGAFARALTHLGKDNQFVFATSCREVVDAFPEAVVINLGSHGAHGL
jgi:hypothetical protein